MFDQFQNDQTTGGHGRAAGQIHVNLQVQRCSCATVRCPLETSIAYYGIALTSRDGNIEVSFIRGCIFDCRLYLLIFKLKISDGS